jgi:putrescine transport system permease protein
MAYAIARAGENVRTPLLMLVVLPFWTSFLIRVYAWTGILNSNGLINNALLNLGLISEPLPLLHSEFAVHLGIVYSYLPFMVLPIYAVLEKFDWTVLEAAADLGAKPLRAFFRVTLPLSLPGIFSGVLLVFIPALAMFRLTHREERA